MEIFVYTQPKGYSISELEDVQELGELLTNYRPLGDNDEVTVEIRAPWNFIRDLLSGEKFHDAWFTPESKGGAT